VSSNTDKMADLSDGVRADDHTYGPASALVTLVEYADFDCRSCAEAYLVVRELSARFAPYLRVVFRHGPRTHDHSRAGLAAEAVEAAGEQGSFWGMHDCLFEHRSSLEAVDFLDYAERLGLDQPALAEAMCNRSHRARIRRDQLSGIRSHVISTPTFFINGTRFAGGTDREALTEAVTRARCSATRLLCARGFSTVVDALAYLLAVTTALRDAYKRHYWHCLALPFTHSRLICGQHAREQSELAAQLSQRATVVEDARPTKPDSAIERLDPEDLGPGKDEREPWLERLLRSHEFALLAAHSVANRLTELGDVESRRWVTGTLVMTNERQAETLTRRILAARRGVSRVIDH
jgi:protein-disulfide isomerase